MAAHPKSRFAPLESTNSADALLADEGLQIFGVADGVGEWETFGLDPGLFPKELMRFFTEGYREAVEEINGKVGDICPILKILLSEAYLKTSSYGSSTVLLGVLQNNTLYTISLGDSTFVVLRQREKRAKLFEVFRLTEQQHSFNCPFQLARFPEPDQYEILIKKGLNSFVSLLKRSNLEMQDKPQDANSEIFHLMEGDIIVAASDGLFDNLFDEDIIKFAETFLGYELSDEEYCNKLAKELVCKAVQKGWDTTYKSPFSKNAAKFGQRYIGGKLDDTTVVVALVTEDL
jgi:protein phosphatase PTC7